MSSPHLKQNMSDSLFGGATNTVAGLSEQLAEIAKNLNKLTEVTVATRNSNVMADAVKVETCPTGLIGCNANELYNKTGGQVTCPPLEQAPDPLIVDSKGRICYAREDIRKQFEGKELNIRKLTESYALKLVKMLENGNNLAVAIEAARAGPKGSPIILNFYANNPYVRNFATGGSRYGFARAPAAVGGIPVFQGLGYGTAGMFRGVQGFDAAGNVIQLVSTEELSALLTKFSNYLDPNGGSDFFATILSSSTPNVPQGSFDIQGTYQLTVHSLIAEYLFAAILATHRDSSRRSHYVNLINGLAAVLKFGELPSANESDENKKNQILTAANAAITFLPKSFRDWMTGTIVTPNNRPEQLVDPRRVLLNFVLVSIVCVTIEAYNNKVPSSRYINSVKALRVAFDQMRKTEYDATQLLEQKAKGMTVSETAVDQALREKKGAAQSYVVQTVKFGTVLADLLGYNLTTSTYDNTNMIQASVMMRNLASNLYTTDPKTAQSITLLRNLTVRAGLVGVNAAQRTMAQTGFGYVIMGYRTPLYMDNAGNALSAYFFQKIRSFSKFDANTAIPEEEVIITKPMFYTQQSAQQSEKVVNAENKAKFASSLPTGKNGFCKVRTGSGFSYIFTRKPAALGDNVVTTLDAIMGTLRTEFQTGNLQGIAEKLPANITSDSIAYFVNKSCEPISDEEYAYVRKMKVLNGSAVDQLFLKYFQVNAPGQIARVQNEGLNLRERDAYSVLMILLQQMGGDPQIAAGLLLATNSPKVDTFLRNIVNNSNNPVFASHGKLAGGEDDLQGGEEQSTLAGGEISEIVTENQGSIEGGEEVDFSGDWENAADLLLNGGAVQAPVHQSGKSVRLAVKNTAPRHVATPPEIKQLHEKLLEKGYRIPYFYSEKCPTYLQDYNNTFGTPGEKRWVETNHPWAKCQERMGFQFVSKNGYCYPYGMTCFPEDDLKTTTIKTVESAENWIQLAKIYNSVQQKKYEEWLEGEKARIRSEPQNAGLTDKEVEAIAKSHMPPEYVGIPDYAAVQTMVTLSTQLEEAVNEIAAGSDSAQREAVKRILRSTGSMKEEWFDEDKKIENMSLDRIATELVEEAKVCTDASITIVNNVAKEDVAKALTAVTINGANELRNTMQVLPPALEQSANVLDSATGNCSVLKTGEKASDAVLIPNSINQRINLEKVAAGEPVDPIVNWWRTYYGKRDREELKKLDRIHAKLSPYESNIPKPVAERETAESLLSQTIKKALDSEGRKMLERNVSL